SQLVHLAGLGRDRRGARRRRPASASGAGMAGGGMIRGFQEPDAAAVARLKIAVNPHHIETAETVWHRVSRVIQRERRRDWVAEVRDPGHGRFEVDAAGERDMPRDEAETVLDLESWKRDEFDVPTLSDEGSFVALARERPVSLAFVSVDPERKLAYNQMTAT